MAAYEKVYVTAMLRVDRDGYSKPVVIEWESGEEFLITRITDVRNAPPKHVGGTPTVRYRIIVRGRERELYREIFSNKWFVEKLLQ